MQLQQKLRKQQEKEYEKAKKILDEITDFSRAQAKKASEALMKNSQFFRPKDLSEEAKCEILKASGGLGVCSRCRWSSGCLSCSAEKALQHFCKVEASKLQNVPKISGLWFCSRGDFQCCFSLCALAFLAFLFHLFCLSGLSREGRIGQD